MTMQQSTIETIQTEATRLFDMSCGHTLTLQTEATRVAATIIACDDVADAMGVFFEQSQQPYLAAKASKAKAKATVMGSAWKRLREAMHYHFDQAGLVEKWPNWASGNGSCSVETKADVAADNKTKRETKAEREALALAAEQQAEQDAEIKRLQALDVDGLALELTSAIQVSGLDASLVLDKMASLLIESTKPAKAKPAKAKL